MKTKKYCCVNCFIDEELISLIKGQKPFIRGTCDFCGSKNVIIYNLEKKTDISFLFDKLLDIYDTKDDLPSDFPLIRLKRLNNILLENWKIFNPDLDNEVIDSLIKTICRDKLKNDPSLFQKKIGIAKFVDEIYLQKNALLSGNKWEDFIYSIRNVNRFYTHMINVSLFKKLIKSSVKRIKAGSLFYRARACPSCDGFPIDEMGAPSNENASAGRVNSAGISLLYLSKNVDTTIYEIRAGSYEYVTVCTFKLKKTIEVIDFSDLDKVSPFIEDESYLDLSIRSVNIGYLKKIIAEISKPLRPYDSVLDYLPTQYFSDLIRSFGYAGIMYKSTLDEGGVNLAVFDTISIFKGVETKIFEIKKIQYTKSDMA